MKKIETLIKKTYKASVALRTANDRQVKQALKMLADAVEENSTALLNANRKDVSKQDASDPRTDRL
ncbi:MAG: gamma-glutamyl-phosphate reductase, partial [Flavisolibacter sp.]|nr:gamma-glutamyl-phosphate reductase [Flavisolibacter sp.]